jgi:glycosyltransferase involved in cell wall biosynthesis/ubiquinone/menaquinone biosynthesis C-methylase UbiE
MSQLTPLADPEPLSLSPQIISKPERQPLLPDVGVIALVPDVWRALWQPRHHVISRLAHYFQVVWIDPHEGWNEYQRNARPIPREWPWSLIPGFAVCYPELLSTILSRFYRLDKFVMRSRLKRARSMLTRRGCQRIILYIWRPTFLPALDCVPHDLSCYHIDDEYSFSPSELPLSEIEERLIRETDQVFVHSSALLEKKGKINPNTLFIPNGVDFEAYSHEVPEPADLARIPHPRIGYTGFLKRHLEWSILLRLCQEHPEWSFIFVGPLSPHEDISSAIRELTSRKNVHFLGPKPTAILHAYPQHFDVCIMPYQANEYTKYVYPLKLHEYLASGRPTVGSRIRTLIKFNDVVALASTSKEWSCAIEKSLRPEENSRERRAARQEVARRYDWEGLVLRIAESMAAGLGPQYRDRLSRLLLSGGEYKADLSEYRASPREKSRISDLLEVVPKGYSSILDIGARDGYISNLLLQHFESVTALDLEEPQVPNKKICTVKGDITDLRYADNAFDVVICTEVLEHIPPQVLSKACGELSRVAKYAVVIGVPYEQDRRVGRTTCRFCGKPNPCWGHVNSFDEIGLKRLFNQLLPVKTSFVGQTKERTNFLATFLMDQAQNPWGTYEQDECCVHCGHRIIPVAHRVLYEKVYTKLAIFLNYIQARFVSPRPAWIHMVFRKANPVSFG